MSNLERKGKVKLNQNKQNRNAYWFKALHYNMCKVRYL